MKTFLFLDDERFPVQTPGISWVIVRTVPQAVRWIYANGMPDGIYFDNDLGERLEGRHLAKWLMRKDSEQDFNFIREGFEFFVHSQNSVNNIARDLNHHMESRQQLKSRLHQKPRFPR